MQSVFSFTLVVLLSLLAPADDLAQKIEKARAELQRAQRQLQDAQERRLRLQGVAAALRQRSTDLIDRISRLTDEAARLEGQLAAARAAIPGLERDLEAASDAIPAARDEAASARGAVQVIESASKQRTEQFDAEFKSSPEYLRSQEQLKVGQRDVDERDAEVRRQIERDEKYQSLRRTADQLKAEVKAMRDGGSTDASVLAGKSQAWMTAESDAGKLIEKAITDDAELKSLKQANAGAIRRARDVVDQFERRKKDDPALAQLAADRLVASVAANRAAEALSQVQRVRDQTASRLAEARNTVATAAGSAASARAGASAARMELDSVNVQLPSADLALNRALQQEQLFINDVRAAEKKLQDLLDQQGKGPG